MKHFTIFSTLCMLLLLSINSFGQVVDTTSTPPEAGTPGEEDFVDLSEQATIIKIEPEKPRVTLITDRIKPEFTDVNLNKSFMKELLSKSDKAVLQDKVAPAKHTTIDIEKFLNKSR